MQTTAQEVHSEEVSSEEPKKFDNVNSANIKRFPRKDPLKAKKAERPTKQTVSRPTKFLPSERITFTRQLDILRGWAAAAGTLRKIVGNNEVAKIVNMQPSTVSMNNAFYASIGLLNKSEGGYSPAEEVTAFLRAWEWNKDTAPHKLAPVLARSWFYETLSSKLEFGPRTEADCLQDLGDAANASQDYKNNLRMLLEYLSAASLIQREGDLVKKGGTPVAASTTQASQPENTSPTPKQENVTV